MKFRDMVFGSEESNREVQVWADVDDEWTAYFRVAISPGLPVAEMRVFPTASMSDEPPPDRGDRWTGNPDEVPSQGVPARGLRTIRLTDVQDHVEQRIEKLRESDDSFTRAVLMGYGDAIAELATKRRNVDPEWSAQQRLAVLAQDYVSLVKAGEAHPNRHLADLWGRTPSQVTADIYNARHRYQLLTKAKGRGEAGGDLTKKAQDILQRMDNQKETEDA